MRRDICILGLSLLLSTIATNVATAHALGVQAKLKDGKILVEAYYDDDSPAIKTKIQIMKGKEEIASRVTDEKGLCTFDAPAPGKYEIHADAGAGHRASTTITIPGATPTTEQKKETPISSGATREEFTGTPWLKIGIGISAIGVLCVAFMLASMMRKNGHADNTREH